MEIRKRLFQSLSTTINTFYVLLIILFTLLTGTIFYVVADQEVSKNTADTMDSVLTQKMAYFSFLYKDIFEQFYTLSKDVSIGRLVQTTSASPQSYLDLSEKVTALFMRQASFIDSIYINIHGTHIVTESDQQTLLSNFDSLAYLDPVTPLREGYYWLNNHKDPIFDAEQDVQSLVYIVENEKKEVVGMMILNLKTAFIEKSMTDLSMEGSYMMFLSPEDYFVSEEAPANTALNETIYQHYLTGEWDALQNDAYLIHHAMLGTNKWEVILVTPKATLFDSKRSLLLLFLVISLVIAVLAGLILRMIRRYISNPILKMAESMQTTESYHEKLSWTEDIPEELSILYHTYNKITDRNVQLIEQMTAKEREKMELEVALLHAQISPHFLYNTLFSIKGLSDMGMNQEASNMISELSVFFRTSLSRGKEIISIQEELKNIKSYLYLMEMRYGDFFSYDITIPIELYDNLIVKLSLQPLVENAIYHGVMHDRGQGKITIGGGITDDGIVFYVEDNGQGIEPEKLACIQAEIKAPYLNGTRNETGVGLRSVDIRLKNRYGEPYGLYIESDVHVYTRVSIRIPEIKGEDNGV